MRRLYELEKHGRDDVGPVAVYEQLSKKTLVVEFRNDLDE
jgi:hypothetical protein